MSAPLAERDIVYLTGGVGGARLLRGLARVVSPEHLTVIVNTGDDLTHWGLRVCPDLDTVMYTLAGIADPEQGWGVRGDSRRTLQSIERLGGPSWFGIGDVDLATHLMRTQWLREGMPLTGVSLRLCRRLGVAQRVLPMTDEQLTTRLDTAEHGPLPMQDWLVRLRGEPAVRAVEFHGDAKPTRDVVAALEGAQLVIIGPSNPYVSIDPILTLPSVRGLVEGRPVLAVSPIVHGQAVKGPLAAMVRALSDRTPSARAIADHYGKLLWGMVVERGDEAGFGELPVRATHTVMRTPDDSVTLAREVLALAAEVLD
jgi:LPPG:FO 2-phospho-L-lactate transferase